MKVNELQLVTRRFRRGGVTITGLRLASELVGPGDRLPLDRVGRVPIGGKLAGWTRTPYPFPIIRGE